MKLVNNRNFTLPREMRDAPVTLSIVEDRSLQGSFDVPPNNNQKKNFARTHGVKVNYFSPFS